MKRFMRLGLFEFIRQMFFGEDDPECPEDYCHSRPDSRCTGNLCTRHCKCVLRCGGKCIELHLQKMEQAQQKEQAFINTLQAGVIQSSDKIQ